VHGRSVLAVTLDAESRDLRSARLPGETVKVVEFLAKLPGPTRVAYEAGPPAPPRLTARLAHAAPPTLPIHDAIDDGINHHRAPHHGGPRHSRTPV
jgi:hypothetical protein